MQRRGSMEQHRSPWLSALLTTSKTPSRIRENFEVATLPETAMKEISEGIKTEYRFNPVTQTGIPGFIPRGR